MKSAIEKTRSMNWRRLRAELSILLMLLAIASPAEATSPIAEAEFDRDQPQTAASEPLAPEGTIEKVWIEYGVKRKGEAGIRIHVKYSVKNALNVPCSLQAFVVRVDGLSMGYTGSKYTTQDGKSVIVLSTFTPPFDRATYPDSKLFIPYGALSLRENNPNKMKLSVLLVGEGKEFSRSSMEFGYGVGRGRIL